MQKPAALRPGDTIAVVAPGSPIAADRLQAGVDQLRRLGYQVRYRDDILAADTFLAGDHERRFREFFEALHDPAVKAILCARGGYGCNYVVERLAASGPLPAPKIIMGYSDVTTLLCWFWQQAGWVTFHGPMVTLEFAAGPGAWDETSVCCALTRTESGWVLADPASVALRPGTAEGTLLGGCLPMLTATLGTRREIRTDGSILLLEDLAAKPYQIDRMLFQLREAGKFDAVHGIVFGEMLDCLQHASQGYRLEDVILRTLSGLDVPIIFGFRSGHTSSGCLAVPFGVPARLVAGDRPQLEILEPAVKK